MSVPRMDDEDAAAAADAFYDAIRNDSRPVLTLWAESDLILTLASGQRLASRIGRRIDHVIPGAGHGLQEDQGRLVGELIAEWLLSNR
jgi:haloalkane dehalogenase